MPVLANSASTLPTHGHLDQLIREIAGESFEPPRSRSSIDQFKFEIRLTGGKVDEPHSFRDVSHASAEQRTKAGD